MSFESDSINVYCPKHETILQKDSYKKRKVPRYISIGPLLYVVEQKLVNYFKCNCTRIFSTLGNCVVDVSTCNILCLICFIVTVFINCLSFICESTAHVHLLCVIVEVKVTLHQLALDTWPGNHSCFV